MQSLITQANHYFSHKPPLREVRYFSRGRFTASGFENENHRFLKTETIGYECEEPNENVNENVNEKSVRETNEFVSCCPKGQRVFLPQSTGGDKKCVWFAFRRTYAFCGRHSNGSVINLQKSVHMVFELRENGTLRKKRMPKRRTVR